MGIKGWIALGVGGLALLGGILGKTRKRGRYEGVLETINAVDLKSKAQEDEMLTVEEMTADVEQAVSIMDID